MTTTSKSSWAKLHRSFVWAAWSRMAVPFVYVAVMMATACVGVPPVVVTSFITTVS